MARSRSGLRFVSSPLPLAVVMAVMALSPAARAQDDDDDILVLDEADAAAATGPQKKIGVVPFVPVGTAEKALAEQVTSAVSSEIKAGAFEIVPLTVGGSGGGGAPIDLDAGKASLEKAKKKIASGRTLLDRLNFRKATQAYESALKDLEKAAPAIVDITPALEAWLGLAEIHARQGDEAETAAALAQAARLAPEHELDPSRYPPLFIRTYAQVRSDTLKEPAGVIFIDRTAVGAEVRIDGREVGTAPVRISNVPAGRHFVRVYREGQGLFGAVVDVPPGGEETVSPGFTQLGAEGPLDLLANNRFSAEAAQKVAEIARKAGVDIAVVGVVGRTQLSVPTVLLAIEPATGNVARIGPMEFDGDLLNLSIEGLKAREGLEKLAKGTGFGPVTADALVPGVKAAAAVEIAEVTLRFDVKGPAQQPERRGPRVLGASEGDGAGARADRRLAGGGEGRRTLSGGGSGRSKSLRDDEDPYAPGARVREPRQDLVGEDIPLVEQPWFWPVAIGGGVAGAAVIVGGAAAGLVASGIVPDPRPNGGMSVQVVVP